MVAVFFDCSLSPSQFCTDTTTATLLIPILVSLSSSSAGAPVGLPYQPIILLRVNMAAMGKVEDSDEDISAWSPLTSGSW